MTFDAIFLTIWIIFERYQVLVLYIGQTDLALTLNGMEEIVYTDHLHSGTFKW